MILLMPRIACCANEPADPSLKQFRVYRSGDEYLISALLVDAFPPEIDARILSGVPTTFDYYLYLKKVRWYRNNRILAHALYHHTVTYDTLRKTYRVVIHREGVNTVILDRETGDPEEMRSLMVTFKGVLAYPYSGISYANQYYVSITASLKTREVPAPWNLFLSNDFKTRTSRKFFP